MKLLLDDRIYHRERAEAELSLAEASPDPSIALIHRQLAAMHRRKMLSIADHRQSNFCGFRLGETLVLG